ncbi:MAG TPA: ureidoglycolate lyase [Gammaproteobacteria bacterium]|jgi:ureidoglycolate lyase|nr:ureidoglycolate lyase [Acidiferrobacteraceae bacterium]MDP6552563.1 ureidoglycolate lyase [Arenicellales bacterium]MDP6791261.1 ureidoglycolate lyase [Arenicellales bacterium]MDP6918324.1 ureidoglycolate lyase [Arenicellales bacterium]HCX88511.1 ureidoglycolate lyase [Gammaproteobacteria bacterium]|tara:strand:- start:3225 stop:3722 length:498 start_codon:yes stop_codon:yes gene_type:complete
MEPLALKPEPLTAKAFAAFGDVIEARADTVININQGTSQRFHDLARVDVASGDGHPLVNIFRASPYPEPLILSMMEKHPLSSQLFMPLQDHTYLVAVAETADKVRACDIMVFSADGHQGVNFRPGTWHHPLLVLKPQDFLVVDRGGKGENLVEQALDQAVSVALA